MRQRGTIIALAVAVSLASPAWAEDFLPAREGALSQQPVLRSLPARQVRRELFAALSAEFSAEQLARASAAWPADAADLSGSELVERLAAVAAAIDPAAQRLVDACSVPPRQVRPPVFSQLDQSRLPSVVRNGLKQLLGNWLVRHRYYEESLALLQGLAPDQAIDPASLLFCQAVAHHRLLHKEPGLAAIARLTEDVADCPRRYRQVALLMERDLSSVQPETIDHVARQMSDIERRLDLGRAGPKVRQLEDDVVAALDRLIQALEPPVPPHPPCNPVPVKPADQSMLPRLRAAGNVQSKPPAPEGGWGNISPGQREQALQQMSKAFPSNFREIMERYFRKIASEGVARTNRN